MPTDPLPLLTLANWGVDRSPNGEPVLILQLRDAGTIVVGVPGKEAREMARALTDAAGALEEPE